MHSFWQIVTDSIGFLTSLLISAAGLFAAVKNVGGMVFLDQFEQLFDRTSEEPRRRNLVPEQKALFSTFRIVVNLKLQNSWF